MEEVLDKDGHLTLQSLERAWFRSECDDAEEYRFTSLRYPASYPSTPVSNRWTAACGWVQAV
jgi:hypothetical protein